MAEGLNRAKSLREERARLIEQAREIQKAADTEGRAMSSEEVQNWDKAMGDADQIRATYERIEKLEEAEAELAGSQGRKAEPVAERSAERIVRGGVTKQDRDNALRAWLQRGTNTMPDERLVESAQRSGVNLDDRLMPFNLATTPPSDLDRDSVREWHNEELERRAQAVGTDAAGGYTVPDDVMRSLEVAMKAFGGMRSVSDILRTSTGASLPWPTLDDTSQKGAILAENAQVTQQDMAFSQLVLDAYKYTSKMILVPVELLQDSAINVAQVIGEALGTRIARITNEHFTVGTGVNQPNGIVTAAAAGVTGATGQTATVTFEDLVELEHSVDPAYRRNARFMFADSTLKEIKKLKDGQNRPLWLPGLAVREPDTILGYGYTINQDMAAMAASAKSILFGDLAKYKVRDVQQVILRRLDERFADYHQVAFLAFSRHDGDLLDAGANPVKYYQNSAT